MTTTASPFTRRTSVYTIRIEAAGSVEMQQIIEQVSAALPNLVDSGESSVSFRTATDDAAALQIAREATDPVAFWATFRLTTGLGVHRREVTHKSVRIAAAGQEA